LLQYFQGDDFTKPGEITIMTNEGPAAVEEYINYLKRYRASSPLQWSNELSHSA
jgi:uncharacterized protein YkwD